MKALRLGATWICFLWCAVKCSGQEGQPVVWRFWAGDPQGNTTTLFMSATLAPGWHLYSQFMEEGGPIPTRFYFRPDDGYVLKDGTRERGDAIRIYDDIFNMYVVWYAREVVFEQDIRFLQPALTIRGVIEYMVCSKEVCIPSERVFSLAVKP